MSFVYMFFELFVLQFALTQSSFIQQMFDEHSLHARPCPTPQKTKTGARCTLSLLCNAKI